VGNGKSLTREEWQRLYAQMESGILDPFMVNTTTTLMMTSTEDPTTKTTTTTTTVSHNNKHSSSLIDNNLTSTLPKRCLPPKELEQLWERSVQIEQDLLAPTFYKNPSQQLSPLPLKPHHPPLREAFDKYVQREKFCSVDFDQLLDTPKWRAVLEQAVQNIGQHQEKE
jgi:lysyl-tRNA synthetase class II